MSLFRETGYRRKRWVSESMAERSGKAASSQRLLELWCEAGSHEAVHIGTLQSVRKGPCEGWRASGPHVTVQKLILDSDRGVDREVLGVLGLVAERQRFLCPECGFDVVTGDRLGNPGFKSVLDRRDKPDSMDMEAWAVAEKTDAKLSMVADSGLERLSLKGFFGIVAA